jgi:hypothetical protein
VSSQLNSWAMAELAMRPSAIVKPKTFILRFDRFSNVLTEVQLSGERIIVEKSKVLFDRERTLSPDTTRYLYLQNFEFLFCFTDYWHLTFAFWSFVTLSCVVAMSRSI